MNAPPFSASSMSSVLSSMRDGRAIGIVDRYRGEFCAALAYTGARQDAINALRGLPRRSAFCVMADVGFASSRLAAAGSAEEVAFRSQLGLSGAEVFAPLSGGIFARPGFLECLSDLAKLAAVGHSLVFCTTKIPETALLREELMRYFQQHSILLLNLADVSRHRLLTETLIRESAIIPLQTHYGAFTLRCFESRVSNPVMVLAKGLGNKTSGQVPLVRIERCYSWAGICSPLPNFLSTGFQTALDRIYREGAGVILLVPGPKGQKERQDFLNACSLSFFQDDPFNTLEGTDFSCSVAAGICAQVLRALGIERFCPISTKASRLKILEEFGLEIEWPEVPRSRNVKEVACSWDEF